MITGLYKQCIIQGKTYSLRLKFDDENLAKINKLWFSCKDLNICQEMTLDDHIYSFVLSWEQTQALEPMETTFNITAELADGTSRDLCNGIYLVVIENLNPVVEQESSEA